MAKKRKRRDRAEETESGFGAAFGDLLAARGRGPQTAADSADPAKLAPTSEPVAFQWAHHPRLRVRLQKKGRGGKKVTRVEGVVFEGDAGRAPARTIGKALGCRAFIEDGALFVQGDQRRRLVAWLTARGVARVDPC